MPLSNGYKKFYRQHIKPEPDFNMQRYAKRPIVELPFAFGPLSDLEAVLYDMLVNEVSPDADLLYSAYGTAETLPPVWVEGELTAPVVGEELEEAVTFCRIDNGEYDEEDDWCADDYIPAYNNVVAWFFEMATYVSLGGRVNGISIQNHPSIREYGEVVTAMAREMYHNLPETPHPTVKTRNGRSSQYSSLDFGSLRPSNPFTTAS